MPQKSKENRKKARKSKKARKKEGQAWDPQKEFPRIPWIGLFLGIPIFLKKGEPEFPEIFRHFSGECCGDPKSHFRGLGGRFGYFVFFLLRGVRGAGRGGGGDDFLSKIPGRGGLPGRVGGEGEGPGGCLRGIWGGGLNIFFGLEIPTKGEDEVDMLGSGDL